ncbi:type I-F CRISPR-associated protein Csy1, partial [Pseudomonas sp. MWU13-2860]
RSKEVHEGRPHGRRTDTRCRRPKFQQLLLEPGRAETDADFAAGWHGEDWPLEVAKRFGRWLNQQFDASPLEMGDAEFRHWARELAGDLGWQAQHDQTRRQLAAIAKEQA